MVKFDHKLLTFMKTVLINVKKESDLSFLLSLAKKLGMKAKALTRAEVEDWQLVQKIEAGMKTPAVSRHEVMKSLGEK